MITKPAINSAKNVYILQVVYVLNIFPIYKILYRISMYMKHSSIGQKSARYHDLKSIKFSIPVYRKLTINLII
jgi:hypothetical protein